MNTFLPKDYSVPESPSRYFKFKQGENRFRILASPIIGNEYWNKEGKPVRKRMGESIYPDDIRVDEDGNIESVKHFWAMPIWDYSERMVKVLEITQKSIQQAITSLVKDEDWGNPSNYDLSISREGERLKTKYEVKPKPSKPLEEDIQNAWQEVQDTGFDLELLYDSGDPFSGRLKNDEINIDDIQL